ncbi:MAG: hypothetical protein IBJ10_11235 [Phycisphaerales bacterium]|nr:hypothetical protein [Phycisphaerales bacterium]
MSRALSVSLALLVAILGFGCASAPELTPQAQTSIQSLLSSVNKVSAQFDSAADALANVRDAWNTDPDAAIGAFSRELMALETAVGGATAPGDARPLSQWDGILKSVLDSQTANATPEQKRALESAFRGAQSQLSRLRDSFAPNYNRMIELGAKLRESPSGATVEALLPELRRAVADSKNVSSRFNSFGDALGALID